MLSKNKSATGKTMKFEDFKHEVTACAALYENMADDECSYSCRKWLAMRNQLTVTALHTLRCGGTFAPAWAKELLKLYED